MQSIPTTYKGRLYRSRLESRWAAFFDQCKWRYEYEPFDLPGWIPDFLLFYDSIPILVEIKPFTTLVEFPLRQYLQSLLYSSYWKTDLWLLGPTLGEMRYGGDFPGGAHHSFGFLGRFSEEAAEEGLPYILMKGESGYTFDFLCYTELFRSGDALSYWAHAANMTQWKSPQTMR